MTRRANAVLVAVVLLGLACAALAAVQAVASPQVPLGIAVALLVVCVLGEHATIEGDDEEGERTFSVATTVHVASAILLAPHWAAIVAIAGSAVGEATRRVPVRVLAFNAAVAGFSTYACGAVFHALHSGATIDWATYPALGVAVLTYVPLNIGPVGAISTAVAGEPWRPLSWLPPSDLITFVMEGCLAAILANFAVTSPKALLFAVPLLVAIFLSLKRYRMLKRETRETLRALVSVVDARDPSTAAHSERVGEMAAQLAAAAGMGLTQVRRVRWAGRLHDLGKLAVEDSVLLHAGPLDEAQWESMRRHPAVSAELVEPLSLFRDVAPSLRYHHERFDGRGYYRLPPEEIPVFSALISIADTFDAMTTDRPYRAGFSEEEALAVIEAEAGRQFHAGLARAFVAMRRGEPVPQVDFRASARDGAAVRGLRPQPEGASEPAVDVRAADAAA